MRDGFIKVAAATPEIRVADCIYNAESTIRIIKQAAEQGVHLLVLPELGLTGYTCGDLFMQEALLSGARAALDQVKHATAGLGMLVAVGLPIAHRGKLYNCAAMLYEGSVIGIVPKTQLPNYGEFYEKRWFACAPDKYDYFTDGFDGHAVPFGTKLLFVREEQPDFMVAVEICEDLWGVRPPSAEHACAGATVIANLSASNEMVGKDSYRRSLVGGQSARLICGYVYANAGEGESTTDVVFSGHNLIVENGTILVESERFTSGMIVSELDVSRLAGERRRLTTFPEKQEEDYLHVPFSMPLRQTVLSRPISVEPFIPMNPAEQEAAFEDILQIQSHGLKKRMVHSQAKSAVIGISGGLDSALALLVVVRAMDLMNRPHTDIVAITMPCFGTTVRTKGNADVLCGKLGVTLHQIDIKASVDQHFIDIGHDPSIHDVTFENAQARERTQVLMDMANRTGGLVVGTGDLSELALGWATYNGDHMSMYGVNASIPKTLVRYLVSHEASKTDDPKLREVLLDILDTPVSPELLPSKAGEIEQKTEDLVGPYELHDFFLFYAVRWAFSPAKILRLAEYAFAAVYTRETIVHWLKIFYRRFFSQQFKRSCLPDGPKIGSVSLSPRGDWRMPSDAASTLWLAQLESL